MHIDDFSMNDFNPIYQSEVESSNRIEHELIINDRNINKSFCDYT